MDSRDHVLSSHFADGETESQILFGICIVLQEIDYSSIVVYKGINPGIIGPSFCSLVLGVFFTFELETDFSESLTIWGSL